MSDTPAERIAAAMCRAYNDAHAVDCRTLAADDEFDAEAAAAIDALCPKGERVVLDRTGDTDRIWRQMEERRRLGPNVEETVWVDIEDGPDE